MTDSINTLTSDSATAAYSASAQLGRSRRKHERLRSQLLGEMAVGRLRPGDALPSEKQMAEMLRVSRTTVRQALGDLEREGMVRRVQGKGTFVSNRPSEQTVTPIPSFAMVVNEVSTGYYPSLLAEFERAAKQAGRPTIVCSSGNDTGQQADQLMHLIHNRVAGIALNPCATGLTPAYQVQVVQDAGIPIVLLHRSVVDAEAPVLLAPQDKIAYRAGRMIVEAGHRRIAFFTGNTSGGRQGFEQGFRAALGESGIELADELMDSCQIKTCSSGDDHRIYERHLEARFAEMMSAPDRPTALFTTFDSFGEVIYLVAGKLGLRIPEDLSIVSYGGTRRDGAVMRRLTAITVDEAEDARQAVQLLLEMSDGRRPIRSSTEVELTMGVSPGETLGPPPKIKVS